MWKSSPGISLLVCRCCLIYFLIGPCGAARAAAPMGPATPVEDSYEAHYRLALSAYGEGRYEEAVAELSAAYELRPLPLLLYNRAQARRRLGLAQEALQDLTIYLQQESSLTQELRARVLAQQEELRLRISRKEAERSASLFGQCPEPAPAPMQAPPVHRRWWFWTLIGGVAAAGAAGAAVAVLCSRPEGCAGSRGAPEWLQVDRLDFPAAGAMVNALRF